MNTDQRPPANDRIPQRRTDRRPAIRFIGLEISMFWTAAVVFIIAVIVILYFVLR